jgi:hypothetical protein
MSSMNGNSISAQPNGKLTDATDSAWKPVYSSPPTVKVPYNPREALDDIPGVCYALEQFLASHMVESEEYCHNLDETKFVHASYCSLHS